MKRQMIVGLCSVALLLAAVSVGGGQAAPLGGKAVDSQPTSGPDSQPTSGPAKDRKFVLKLYKPNGKKPIFEKTYDAPAGDKGELLPKDALGRCTAPVYLIGITWPDNPPPNNPTLKAYNYQVSRMTKPFDANKVDKNKLYLGKESIQFLALENKEGNAAIEEAVEAIVKDVKFRMSHWDDKK